MAALAALAMATGCGPTFADLPLPGNGVSGDTIEVRIQFDEALNLSRGAAVKVNGVASGKVREVSVEDFKAVATIDLRTSAELRRTATARLRYTTPLGELFVDVNNPDRGPLLPEGGLLDPANSTTAPTVEDALSSASLLVNGGGLNQLQTVTDNLNQAIGGREPEIRELLTRANAFLSEINAATPQIDRALNALARVSEVLNDNRSTVRAALRDIRPAARVLRENTAGLTKLLETVTDFSDTANGVVLATRDDLLAMVRRVSPVLDEFLSSRAIFGPSLTGLIKAGEVLDQVVPGDYVNLRLELEMTSISPPDLFGPGGGGSTGQRAGARSGAKARAGQGAGSETVSPVSLTAMAGGAR